MLEIYLDFSAYSDMAIGMGLMVGFHYRENFMYPYAADSVTDFWRRWHISLSSFFRDYVYIPLGGNRVGKLRHIFNLFAVWFLTGLWHGASWNFVLWGLLYGAFLCVEKLWLKNYLAKIPAVCCHFYVMLVVVLGFVIFDSASLAQLIQNFQGLFGANSLPLTSPEALYLIRSYGGILVLSLFGCLPAAKLTIEKIKQKPAGQRLFSFGEPILLTVLLLICTAYLVNGSYNPFLYFRF